MKTIELEKTSSDVSNLLEQARADEVVVVRLADGSEFLVISLDEFDHEIDQIRSHPGLVSLLESRARQSPATTLDEVKRLLNL
jgi:hypothetical protein